MTKKRILVTGASGCIGHYISEALIQNTNHELYLLVRNPNKLQVDTTVRPGITILQGDMQEIGKFSNLLKTIDIAVLTATSWGGEGIFDINVFKTLELMSLLNPEKCEQVIYFSTASVLNNEKAIEINIAIMRSFVSLRKFALTYEELTKRVTEIEQQFPDIYKALNHLMDSNQQHQIQQERIKIGYTK
jgi:nucleoside-diphosphate-sugar epimerase